MADAKSSYAGGRAIYDADSHLMETTAWLHEYADPDVRALLGPMNLSAFPDPEFVPDYTPDYYESGWDEKKIKDAEEHLWQRKQWAALGAVDPVERKVALDMFGFKKQIVFATFCWGQFDTLAYAPSVNSRESKLLYGGARAHNRGVADFCKVDSRMIATGMVPLDDPELAIEMTDELLNEGCKAIIIPTGVMEERSWSHPDYDPVWARLNEANVPIVLHVGTGNYVLPKALYNTGRPLVYMMAGRGRATGNESGWVMQDLLTTDLTIRWFLLAMLNDGVFAKFDNLKCVVTEYSADWIPAFGERLDGLHMQAERCAPDVYSMSMKPSEYFSQRVKHAPLVGALTPPPEGAPDGKGEVNSPRGVINLGEIIDSVPGGERMFLFASDYPHAEGGPDPLAALDAALSSLGSRADEVRRLMFEDNFVDVYGR
jgi:predicted TIM-barrel fold metal-dependent hydrolase